MSKAPAGLWWLLLAVACSAPLGLLYLQAYGHRPYEPVQPVPFDHNTHTLPEKAGMPCLACHQGADAAAQAGMPAADSCLDCHRHILAQDPRLLPLHATANSDSPAYTGDPLRWQRAYPLPAHAHFHHGVHAAKYDCERCHPTPGRETPMHMSDCLQCHREEQQPTDCTMCHH